MSKFRFIDWILAFYCFVLTLLCIKSKIDSILDYGSLTQNPEAMKARFSDRLLFMGGTLGSGLGLLGAMVEGHPNIECGTENGVFLDLVRIWRTYDPYTILDPGLTNETVDEAIALFMLIMVAEHTPRKNYLCHKDPYVAEEIVYLNGLFPRAKFLMLVRDGRAVVNSLIDRNGDEKNSTTYQKSLIEWNHNVSYTLKQCLEVGPDTCMLLYYELLVNEPELWLRRVAKFLNTEYRDSMVHYHEKLANRVLRTIDLINPMNANVTREINNGSFYRWLDNLPEGIDYVKDAPMLQYLGKNWSENTSQNFLGYDTENKVPDYSTKFLLKGYERLLEVQRRR